MLAVLAAYIRAYIGGKYKGGDDFLAVLSVRLCDAAQELHIRFAPQFFEVKHGHITGTHLRTFARVVEVVMCDLDEADDLFRVIRATLRWYWAMRGDSFTHVGVERTRALGLAMEAEWVQFDTPAMRATFRGAAKLPKGRVVDLPKFHRAVAHIHEYILDFGPAEDLTTETTEGGHKPLKQMFRWCASSHACAK